LIFQDLAVIPFLIIIPTLGQGPEVDLAPELAYAFLKAVFVIGVMLAGGHYVLRPLFYTIAKQHSSELFTLTILLFSVAAAWVTDLAGLSLALGAFIAGMMLAETEFRHQVEVDIRPFRDVLLGLFFITIGMLLNLQILPSLLHWVVLCVLAILIIKSLVIMLIGGFFSIEKGIASRTALTLAQGGEFGFAILTIAFTNGLLSEELSQVILASLIISMALSPFIIRHNGYFAKHWFVNSYMVTRERNTELIEQETRNIENHVIICGYGRIGQNIARFLKQEGFEYAALDLDPVTIKEAHDAGEHVFYGDSTHMELLKAVNISKASVLVISYDDFQASVKIIQATKILHPDLPILVRTRDDAHLLDLQNLGATEVVPETLEASLVLSSHLLMLLNVPMKRVVNTMQEVRKSRYQLLHEFFRGQDIIDVSEEDNLREGLHSITVPEGAACIGKNIEQLALENCNVKISTLRHDGISHQKPDKDAVLEAGDVLVLYATPEDSERAQTILLKG
jgi:CPA2 family monovalent cation:H+ antiporter-2